MAAFAVRYHHLPLAVYREIAAHLQCIDGVTTELVPSQDPEFHYLKSQVAFMVVRQDCETIQPRVKQVLDSYGLWQQSDYAD